MTDKVLNDTQIKFIEWVHSNKISHLTKKQAYIINLVMDTNPISRARRYCENSIFQEQLNQVRDLYIKEYAQTR